EPKSSEPESEILSIELWNQINYYLQFTIFYSFLPSEPESEIPCLPVGWYPLNYGTSLTLLFGGQN
ncbi:MAG TPA: hypothetical protein PLB87_11825, partial [Prolixibacteraceae bacterium]|nr:hypothetical protein [Prolixibacteraceae bacterium]